MRLAEHLEEREVVGFYTEEIRDRGRRQGFRAVTFSGQTAIMAHTDFAGRSRLGRYGVDLDAFEELVLPELARPGRLVLIDEIGKMECFSPRFVTAARKLLDGNTPVVAAVAAKGGGLIAEVKARTDVEIRQVTHLNRDELPRRLAEALGEGR